MNPFHRDPNKLQRLLKRQHKTQVRRFKRFHAHPVAVPAATFLFLTLASLVLVLVLNRHQAPVPNAYIVIIKHDHATQIVPSREPNVGALLAKLNIKLDQGDVVEPGLKTPINQEDFRINVYRAVPVQVVDGGHTTFTFSAATTSRSITTQAGITTYAEDEVQTAPIQNFVTQGGIGEQVIINRSTPVNFNLYGTLTTTRTHAKTVGQFIQEKKITLAKNDQVSPAEDTPLTPGIPVFVTRTGTKLENITEPITMPVQIIQDDTLAFGTGAIRQAGSPGEQITTYEDELQNGVVVGRKLVQTVITKPAVTQIEVQGTSLSGIKADMALAGISPGDYNYADYIISHESGWCPTKAQGEHYCPVQPDNQFTSAGYGLCQATPGSKMSSAGSDWATNPVTQLRWCNGYAVGHYGSWGAAYNHWI
ncbi:MAG: ubiquitin-like domain-containing protein, partial [Candidatus Saccharimonadales bacterium]